MHNKSQFTFLDTTDSTNNCATGAIRAGMASYGDCWLAKEQTAGRGQRGKSWESKAGENLLMSIAIQPPQRFQVFPFTFSATVALAICTILEKATSEKFSLKWPNDIYYNDNKAGGILIENIYTGADWKWAVVGLGINVMQTNFHPALPNPASLKTITGLDFTILDLARDIHTAILKAVDSDDEEFVMQRYNEKLYKRGCNVRLKKGATSFDCLIEGVNKSGQLVTKGAMSNRFNFGEVEWLL